MVEWLDDLIHCIVNVGSNIRVACLSLIRLISRNVEYIKKWGFKEEGGLW